MATLAVDGGAKTRTEPWPARRLFGEAEKQAAVALFDRCIETGGVFGYNGPDAYAQRVLNYGHNHALTTLGGHGFDAWNYCVDHTWGLSFTEGLHKCKNSYRSGYFGAGVLAFLACPPVIEGSDAVWWNDHIAEYEPHLDMPISVTPPFSQGDGGFCLRRNYVWGDGHVVFINRDNRTFTSSDQF